MDSIKRESCHQPWRRMVALVTTDSFRVSLERQGNPSLLGQPVVIISGAGNPIVLEVSGEANARGIRAGMPWAEARPHSPGCLHVTADHDRYIKVSGSIMEALREISPELEPIGPGEAFLDLTRCQSYYRHQPALMGRLIMDSVNRASGLSCSVGISGDKTTARWAARHSGPDGLRVIHPRDASEALQDVPLTELCGLGPEVAAFFASYGVIHCGDMKKIPVSVPARHFGSLGRRLWMMAMGCDPSPVRAPRPEPGALSHGKILPPGTPGVETLEEHFFLMAEKLASRVSREGLAVRAIHAGILCPEGWRMARIESNNGCSPHDIARLCRRFLKDQWFGEAIHQLKLQVIPACSATGQDDFFAGDRAAAAPSRRRRGVPGRRAASGR